MVFKRKVGMSLHQVYKPVGKTPLEIANEFKKENGGVKKVAPCGRLDPMAHGYLLLACDSETKKMDIYNLKDKVYTVKVLVGVSTDSTDRLGVIDCFSGRDGKFGNVVIDCIKSYNNKTYNQAFHVYSSIMVIDPQNGRKVPYWYLTKIGRVPEEIPSKSVTIYSVSEVLLEEKRVSDIKKYVFEDGLDLLTTSGDFGVDNIRNIWTSYFRESTKTEFEVVTFTVKVSSGTYIRQLVKDISLKTGVPLVVVDLFRHKFDDTTNTLPI